MATQKPRQLANLRVSAETLNSSVAALHIVQLDSTGGIIGGSPGGGSTQVSIREILSSSGGSLIDSSNVSLGVTIRAGSAAGTEYTDGDVDVTVSGGAILFENSSNTLRPVTLTRGLPVNIVAGSASSTQVAVSSIAGAVTVRSSAADFLGTVYQSTYTNFNTLSRIADRDQSTQVAGVVNTDPPSTTWGLAVRQVGAVAASTQVSVSSIAGAVIMRSSAADALVTASQGGTWNIGTVTTVSSVAGRVAFSLQHATLGIVDAADSTNNALRVNVVAGSAAGSTEITVRQSTYTDFNALSRIADRDQSSQVAGVVNTDPPSTTWGLAVRQVGAVAASTQVAVSSVAGRVSFAVQHVTDGILNAGDSTNNALRVNVVAGSAAGSTEVTVRQSTYTDFNGLFRLADRDASTQVAAVLNATPASTVWALAVRTVGAAAGSTEVTVRQSTYTDFNALSRIADRDSSTQVVAVLNATPASSVWALAIRDVVPQSTTVNISSLAGAVIVRSSAADSLHTVYQSTFTDLNCRINAPSTANSSNFLPVRITNSTAFLDGSLEYTDGSTVSTLAGPALVYGNSSNDTMRLVKVTQPLPVQLRTGTLDLFSTTVLITSTHSTARYSLVSSAAGVAHKVFAYFIGSTHTNPSTFVFQSSGLGGNAGSDKFHVNFGSGSSGITGANMSVTPPAYLFKTAVNEPLVCYLEGGNATVTSTTLARISISYFTEA